MTKEKLLSNQVLSKQGHLCVYLDDLNEFFSKNVVIPKDSQLQEFADGKWLDLCYISENCEYRIKPQEPVYEYKYALWYCSMRFISDHYLTEDEFATLNTQQTVELLKETKRERK